MGGNQIGNVPDSIGYMRSLVVLNLSGNRLRTLPRSISCKINKIFKEKKYFLGFLQV
jgi:Leucine-rich repeat (LRR) protein